MKLEKEEILKIIDSFFECGKTKDLAPLQKIQSTMVLEELRFVSISDYDYKIKNSKISIFGNTAIVAMEINQKGLLVDTKSYTGEHFSMDGRATFVLIKQPTWKIIHIHLSKASN